MTKRTTTRFSRRSCKFSIGEPSSNNASQKRLEALSVIVLTQIVTVDLLIKVAEQVERLDTDVGALPG